MLTLRRTSGRARDSLASPGKFKGVNARTRTRAFNVNTKTCEVHCARAREFNVNKHLRVLGWIVFAPIHATALILKQLQRKTVHTPPHQHGKVTCPPLPRRDAATSNIYTTNY